ncbi:hypothetical protein J7L24_00285 [bacterium]|nr:hypothetical protein [bacterium]
MPKQVLPDAVEFTDFTKKLLHFGFRLISDKEFISRYKSLQLVAPRPREGGREVGFVFKANGLRVTVWTTWLRSEQRARKTDAAWVVISDEEKVFYFSHPIHRTKNFLDNLLKQAWIAMHRVKNRPSCPKCGQYMVITHGKGAKSCYWCCSNKLKHDNQRNVHLDWDYGLPDKAKQYLKRLRKKRASYRKNRRAKGLEIDVARRRRISWASQRKRNKNPR